MLDEAVDQLVYGILGLARGTALGESLHFFIADSVKIALLIFGMISLMGVVRTYIPRKRMNSFLSEGRSWLTYPMAATFGAITPFCSCSSIPIFMGLVNGGVPVGPAITFLVTSPLINEYLAVLMLGFFGVKVTVAYIAFGVLLGMATGIFLSNMGIEKHLQRDMGESKSCGCSPSYDSLSARMRYGLSQATSILRGLWLWILAGVGIGALIHGYVPKSTIEAALEATGPLSPVIATVIGIPVYAHCAAIVPVATALFQKGLPLGTTLSFMMASAALSLPEAILLKKVMDMKLMLMFFTSVGVGIVLIGYVFNYVGSWPL